MTRRIAISGAAGRMGRRIIALASQAAGVQCVAALEPAGSPHMGRDAGDLAGTGVMGVPVTDRLTADFDALIDFSTPTGSLAWLEVCAEKRRPFITGVTGFTPEQHRRIAELAGVISVVKAPNMSVGVNVLLRILPEIVKALGPGYDAEITETHHRGKVDSPSGTAIALLDALQDGRRRLDQKDARVIYGRQGHAPRDAAGEIAVHSLRMGGSVGEHDISLACPEEVVTIRHAAYSRDAFAAGAIRAAKWIVGQSPGLYTMQDVLFGGA